MKKLSLLALAVCTIAVFALSISATPALADSIDFNFQDGVLSYNNVGVVTGSVTASMLGSGPELEVERNGTINIAPTAILGTFSFTTGSFVSGNGSVSTPFTWNAGGSISVSAGATAMVNGANLSGDSLFTGMFTGTQSATIGASGQNATFTADFVGGDVNPALLAALGFPTTTTSVEGVLTENFVITSAPGASITASLSSGDLTMTPVSSTVPEPGTFFLLGSGAFGIMGLLRRKIFNS